MAFDYDRLFDQLIASVAAAGPISVRMQSVIDECVRQRPHPDWERLRQIDFDADRERIEGWFALAFPNPPGFAPRGLWFGICNPVIDDEPTAGIYAGCSPDFDSVSIDWAAEIDAPHCGSYLDSFALREIYRIAYESGDSLGNDAEYPLALAYGAMAADAALKNGKLPPAFHALMGAAAGFDSGDLLFLGEFAAGRFVPDVRAG